MRVHIGHDALNVANLDVRIHTHVTCFGTRRCLSCNNRKLEGLSEFFFCSREMSDTTNRKNTRGMTTYLKKKLLRFHIFSYRLVQIERQKLCPREFLTPFFRVRPRNFAHIFWKAVPKTRRGGFFNLGFRCRDIRVLTPPRVKYSSRDPE